ncbi:hypothetical protein [Streptomyces sp. NPDC006645]|uniref:hypothetical protein n=1 Tax=unclassified Streptomyces TaxID=2593676 RepID=UPI0033ABDED3
MRGVVGHNHAPTGRQLTVSPHAAGDGEDDPPQGPAQYGAEPGRSERGSRSRPGAAGADVDGTAPPTTPRPSRPSPRRPVLAPLAVRAGGERDSDRRARAPPSVPGDRRAAPQPSPYGAGTRPGT